MHHAEIERGIHEIVESRALKEVSVRREKKRVPIKERT